MNLKQVKGRNFRQSCVWQSLHGCKSNTLLPIITRSSPFSPSLKNNQKIPLTFLSILIIIKPLPLVLGAGSQFNYVHVHFMSLKSCTPKRDQTIAVGVVLLYICIHMATIPDVVNVVLNLEYQIYSKYRISHHCPIIVTSHFISNVTLSVSAFITSSAIKNPHKVPRTICKIQWKYS